MIGPTQGGLPFLEVTLRFFEICVIQGGSGSPMTFDIYGMELKCVNFEGRMDTHEFGCNQSAPRDLSSFRSGFRI